MTSGELKFALRVEAVLNTIPQPEYRQLVVEALMVLTLVVEHDLVVYLGETLYVEELVHSANKIFLQEQVRKGLFARTDFSSPFTCWFLIFISIQKQFSDHLFR
jgi:hypothetical protein